MRLFRQENKNKSKSEPEAQDIYLILSPFFDSLVTRITIELQKNYKINPESDEFEISWCPLLLQDLQLNLENNPQVQHLMLLSSIISVLIFLSGKAIDNKHAEEHILVELVTRYVSQNLEKKLRELGYTVRTKGLTILIISC